MKHSKDMPFKEKCRFFAGAKRADARKLGKFKEGNFYSVWVGSLGGVLVTLNEDIEHLDRASAVRDAQAYRKLCAERLVGLSND